jgi:Na+-transporting methylmalonyl-CoA/oxaloacetate decarboxylase gamma subunit
MDSMKIRILWIKPAMIVGLLLFCTLVQAQRTTSLRINEILVINETNYQDDYGIQHPWIEIYNSSAGTVNIAGCFLTINATDPRLYQKSNKISVKDIYKNDPRVYPIPKGDVLTKVKPSQHLLFFADAQPTRGTFHLSFSLDTIHPNFIALFDSDGRTLIDSITVPAGQVADVSYGLVHDGWNAKRLAEELRLNQSYKDGDQLWIQYTQVTPSSNNFILDKNDKVENFQKNDAEGLGMTLTAMGVVFVALIALYLSFKFVGNTAVRLSNKRAMQASGLTVEQAEISTNQSGEIFAAIAMAMYEATELHDEENTILTIQSTARNYSPWSSKIHTLRELPSRK